MIFQVWIGISTATFSLLSFIIREKFKLWFGSIRWAGVLGTFKFLRSLYRASCLTISEIVFDTVSDLNIETKVYRSSLMSWRSNLEPGSLFIAATSVFMKFHTCVGFSLESDNPSLASGSTTVSALIDPFPKSSQVKNKFLANSICF